MKRNTENIFLSIFLISQAMLFGAMIIFAITLTKQVSESSKDSSIGYATVIEGDTFETLFSRADKALYHVKKNGKNSFACYSPEMEKEG